MQKLVLALLAVVAGCSASCPEPATGGAVTAKSADTASIDLAARAEKLADETCACPDTACAESVSTELTSLLRGRDGPMSGEPTGRVLAAVTKLLGCRDRLSYPSDPVDMDGGDPASGDAGGGSAAGSATGSN